MTETIEGRNPLLEPENYAAGYNEEIKKLRNIPEVVEFDKLCYELFEMNEQGKRFLELAIEKFVIPAKAQIGSPTYQIDIIWAEGYKQPFREMRSAIRAHQDRIMAGNNK